MVAIRDFQASMINRIYCQRLSVRSLPFLLSTYQIDINIKFSGCSPLLKYKESVTDNDGNILIKFKLYFGYCEQKLFVIS